MEAKGFNPIEALRNVAGFVSGRLAMEAWSKFPHPEPGPARPIRRLPVAHVEYISTTPSDPKPVDK